MREQRHQTLSAALEPVRERRAREPHITHTLRQNEVSLLKSAGSVITLGEYFTKSRPGDRNL